MHELILGGQKSGKSRAAEARAAAWLAQPATPAHEALLIATARAGDDEMAARIARHQRDRALRVPALQVLEEPVALADALARHSAPQRLLVVDCLTLWLTHLLMPPHGPALGDADADTAIGGLAVALAGCPGPVVLVSNEIGLGLVPLGAQARRFVDRLGLLHQRLGAVCTQVTLMVAGRALRLPKETP